MAKDASRIVVSENNRTFSVVVPRGCGADKIHIDDVNTPQYACLNQRCDWAIRVSQNDPKHFFFVELKGNDVLHALEQLSCTIRGLGEMYADYGDRQAWIIAKGYPAIVLTRIQKERALLKRNFRFDLKWKSKSCEVNVA